MLVRGWRAVRHYSAWVGLDSGDSTLRIRLKAFGGTTIYQSTSTAQPNSRMLSFPLLCLKTIFSTSSKRWWLHWMLADVCQMNVDRRAGCLNPVRHLALNGLSGMNTSTLGSRGTVGREALMCGIFFSSNIHRWCYINLIALSCTIGFMIERYTCVASEGMSLDEICRLSAPETNWRFAAAIMCFIFCLIY